MNSTKYALYILHSAAYNALNKSLANVRLNIDECTKTFDVCNIKNNKEIDKIIYGILELAKKANEQLFTLSEEINNLNKTMSNTKDDDCPIFMLDE